MYGYRCDRCGTPVNVDPGEERICDECLQRQQKLEKQFSRIVYQPERRVMQRVS